ncbi:alpha-amylase, partial [Halorubrum saccharovorum]
MGDMHHPGPPRFLATGETTELAPRDPDPSGSYAWRVVDAPPDSEATVGTGPVTEFTPDVPGRYRIGLGAPDGDHLLTVRAFPSSYEGVDVEGGSGTAIRDRTAGDAPVDYAEPRSDESVGRPRVRLDASVDEGGNDAESEIVVRATATTTRTPRSTRTTCRVRFVADRDVASGVAVGRTSPRDALETSD